MLTETMTRSLEGGSPLPPLVGTPTRSAQPMRERQTLRGRRIGCADVAVATGGSGDPPSRRRFAIIASVILLGLPGCADLVAVERSLADQATRGVELARSAIDDRDAILAHEQSRQRAALDRAFDDDVRARGQSIDPAWVIEARKAYAIGLDALASQSQSNRERAATDRANVDATLESLRRLRAIQDAKLQLISNVNGGTR
jgi:hypothetical protein